MTSAPPKGLKKAGPNGGIRCKFWAQLSFLKGKYRLGLEVRKKEEAGSFFFFCPLAPQAPILLDLKSTVVKPGEWRYRTLTYVKYK